MTSFLYVTEIEYRNKTDVAVGVMLHVGGIYKKR